MNKPHVHAELIKAWADGVKIERLTYAQGSIPSNWIDDPHPSWNPDSKYRLKPPKKTPGQVYFAAAWPLRPWKNAAGHKHYEDGAKAVIEAYKQGMFDEDCNC